MKKNIVSLSLERYDDLFSYFDPRAYSQRSLSDDFLVEAKRAFKDRNQAGLGLNLIVPADKRKTSDEAMIKKRFKAHSKRHFGILNAEIKKIKKQGGLFVFFGMVSMFIATLIWVYYGDKTLLPNFLIILLEPGGWFLFWEGLDLIIFSPKELYPDFEFYKKLLSCKISFSSA